MDGILGDDARTRAPGGAAAETPRDLRILTANTAIRPHRKTGVFMPISVSLWIIKG